MRLIDLSAIWGGDTNEVCTVAHQDTAVSTSPHKPATRLPTRCLNTFEAGGS